MEHAMERMKLGDATRDLVKAGRRRRRGKLLRTVHALPEGEVLLIPYQTPEEYRNTYATLRHAQKDRPELDFGAVERPDGTRAIMVTVGVDIEDALSR